MSQCPLRHQHLWGFSTVCWFLFSFFARWILLPVNGPSLTGVCEFQQIKRDIKEKERLWKCCTWTLRSNNMPLRLNSSQSLFLQISNNCRKYWSFTASWILIEIFERGIMKVDVAGIEFSKGTTGCSFLGNHLVPGSCPPCVWPCFWENRKVTACWTFRDLPKTAQSVVSVWTHAWKTEAGTPLTLVTGTLTQRSQENLLSCSRVRESLIPRTALSPWDYLFTGTACVLDAACAHIWSSKRSLHSFTAYSIHPCPWKRVVTFYLRPRRLTWKWCRQEWRPAVSGLCDHVRGGAVVCMLTRTAAGGIWVCVSLRVLIKDGQASVISPLAIAAKWMPKTRDCTQVSQAWRLSC